MISIVSFNVNGLRDLSKFQQLCTYCSENYYDVVGLQETFWSEDLIENLSKFWSGQIFHSCSDIHRQGVAFLISKKIENEVKYIQGFDGRCIQIQLHQDDKVFDIVNCYAPNLVLERSKFFDSILDKLSDPENVILLGDLNTSMSTLDRCGRSQHTEDKAYKSISKFCDNFNLYDVWRSRNPNARVYSWRRVVQNILIQSRIDFIFIPKSFSVFVKNIYHKHSTFSDHSLVVLNIEFCEVERGPGLWVFNNTLLNDEEFVLKIEKLIETEKQCRLYDDEPLIWYDNLKFKIKQLSKVVSKDKKRAERSEYFKIQREFEKFSLAVANDEEVDINKFEEIKLKLKSYEDIICKGAILRSKAHWAIEGDKNSKYFLELEKYKQKSNAIKELKTKEGIIVNTTEQILEEVRSFYEELYSCTHINKNSAHEILDFITKKVPENDMENLEADFTCDEIKTALFSMTKNKSPGPDGLTAEFFCRFYHLFENIFMKIFSIIQEEQIMTRSMRHGVITLIYKNRGDKNSLKNFRPISLLCVDYKIMARIMSNRLKFVLPKLISNSQTCCILGRDIADTTSSIRDLIEIIENDNLEAYLIKVDQEKAFDKVDHDYLFLVLQKFGFGPKFIEWIKIFYKNVNSSVKCNGFLTKYVKLKNSIKQGCPLSALLYVIAAEPLGQAIAKNQTIRGVTIPKSEREARIFQHADDTNIFTSDKNSIDEVFNVLKLYSDASGAKINKQKSEIMCLGSGTLSDNELNKLEIQRCEDVTKVLGIYVGKNRNACDDLNWRDKLKKIKTILFFWLKRDLTLPGRATVLTSLIISRFYYTLTVCPLPEYVKNELRVAVMKFLWQNKAHLVKYQTIVGEKLSGGLNIPDIFIKMQAFRIKFLRKYLDPDCTSIWKVTLDYFIFKIDHMNLKQNIVYTFLNSAQLKRLPLYYQEMFAAFYRIKSKLKFQIEVQHAYSNPIFCNPKITHNGKMLLFDDFAQAGLIQIKDVCYEFIPGFFTSDAIVEIIHRRFPDEKPYTIESAFNKILRCIPDEWKILLRHNNPVNANCVPQIMLCFENNAEIPLLTAVTKQIYKLFMSTFFEKPTSELKWAEKFPSINFRQVYSVANQVGLCPDLHCLNYRLVNRAIFTLDKLSKFSQVDTNTCKACGYCTEDLAHLFIFCTKLKSVHDYLKDLLHNIFINVPPDIVNMINYDELIYFGYLRSSNIVNVHFLNFLLSIARLCIFKVRNILVFKGKNLDTLRLFKYTMQKYVEYAYSFYKMKNQMWFFEKYFLRNNTLLKIQNDKVVLFL